MNKIEKLNLTDFYDVYGISLLEKNNMEEKNYLLALLLPIAKKYLNITIYALRSECRYFLSHCEGSYWETNPEEREFNKKIIKKHHIKVSRTYRKRLTLETMLDMFFKGKWEDEYGGEAWGEICRACIDLQKSINSLNLCKILLHIDRLNDLEHNNALYLKTYSTFDLEQALEYKRYAEEEEEIYKKCSYDIQKLTKGVNIYG